MVSSLQGAHVRYKEPRRPLPHCDQAGMVDSFHACMQESLFARFYGAGNRPLPSPSIRLQACLLPFFHACMKEAIQAMCEGGIPCRSRGTGLGVEA